MTDTPFVFISYSSKEYPIALQVNQVLTENGLVCWMAPQSIPGGSDYTRSIPEAIANCGVFVLVCSANSQSSYWVKSEVIEAISHGKTIIPFIIDDFPLNQEFNFLLSPAHRITAYHNKEASYKSLVDAVRNFIPAQPQSASPVQMISGETSPEPESPGDASTVVTSAAVITSAVIPAEDAAADISQSEAAEVRNAPPAADDRPDRVSRHTQNAPEHDQAQRAKIKLSPISFVPNMVSWLVWGVLTGLSLIYLFSNGREKSAAIVQADTLFAILMHAVTAVDLFIVKKHKTNDTHSVNMTRRLLTATEIVLYILMAVVPAVVRLIVSRTDNYVSISAAYSFILTITFIALSVICTVKFKRGRSFLWFKNTGEPKREYSSIPSFVMITLMYISLFSAVTGSVSAYNPASVSYYLFKCLTEAVLLTVCLISLIAVRRHKSAPVKSIKRSRVIITVIFIVYSLYSYGFILANGSSWYSISSAQFYTEERMWIIIPGVVLALAAVVYTFVFRRLKYSYDG